MALDSADKRSSALGFNLPWSIVIPDGSVDDNDRQTLSWMYGGIAAGSSVSVLTYYWNSPYTRAYYYT